MQNVIFIDTEIGVTDRRVHDIGAYSSNGSVFHSGKISDLTEFIAGTRYICGHNIIHHDLHYLESVFLVSSDYIFIDTLYLSPLLFPKRPYHKLLKDDKLQTDELNNPVNDCKKAAALLEDEITAFDLLPKALKQIFYLLLKDIPEFSGFFQYINYSSINNGGFFSLFKRSDSYIKDFFDGKICGNADIHWMVERYPVELAYALALINAGDSLSVIPPWTLKNYPRIYDLVVLLKNKPCAQGCSYCREKLNAVAALNKFFGYSSFRTYNGEPLQEKAVQAAIDGKSLLVVFPTGGGKSITFQIPALMAGENAHGLTVVISPLQSLMKDQVDNLRDAGITGAVTVNGLLSPIERSEAYARISDGTASILYISPEMLRSKTIEKMLLSRNVVRFVIDEAHCFSSWGQDFRIDYLYIGDFIQKLQSLKSNGQQIAVSCFTATAKQKVISDIRDYFKEKLGLELEIFASDAARENLTYNVFYKENDEDKYSELRNLVERKNCPTIVYVSHTRRTRELAERLSADGFLAKPFNGKMNPKDKIENQEAFIRNEIQIIVATSAFGMGVDKKDIRLVVHYDISDSLENYIQESGRAGRDTGIQAECYVLYNESDLDKHFILLNQTKLSINDIQQVWQAIKRMTGTRKRICCSALEIARMAGWDSGIPDVETRVKTAIAALENAHYIHRGNNVPRVYATGILAKTLEEASQRIDQSKLFVDEKQKQNAKRIIKSLISSRSVARAGNDDAESRVDYLADILGIPKSEAIGCINSLREDGLLADTQDMSAYLLKSATQRGVSQVVERFAKLEKFLWEQIPENTICEFNLKELNAQAEAEGLSSVNVKNIRTLLYFLAVKQYIRKEEYRGQSSVKIVALLDKAEILRRFEKRLELCRFVVEELYAQKALLLKSEHDTASQKETLVPFSLVGLYNKYKRTLLHISITLQDMQDALLYLSTIGVIRLEGGFLVLYNGMEIVRLEMENRIRYKREDYASLHDFYIQKIQQIHIVGEFANMMVKDYDAALQFVNDYFQMDYRQFISKYFKGGRAEKLNTNMTSQRYEKLFGSLSVKQKQIIDDDESKHIVVVAGPGSGKTRVLVHKLAAMLTLEDVKHEQLLMVTFSRAAATEFKLRLHDLIGNAANFVEIKTFHSYCFDLMGKIGNLDDVGNVVQNAVKMIQAGEVELERISKTVLVIDEAQDMDQDEYNLLQALMAVNDGMRVIAVGDDDQNIYDFRGSDSKFMRSLVTDYDARMYELVENYRSKKNIVGFANSFAHLLKTRLKNQDIVSVSNEAGRVQLIQHVGENMEDALVSQVKEHLAEGTACVMTPTNDQAFRILGLLLKQGVHAKLIQSIEGFSLHNLAEVRYFLKKISPDVNASGREVSPIISDEVWEKAKEKLRTEYADSACLENCLKMLSVFEKSSARKYRSDFEEFIRESKFEDFYQEEATSVCVSTIHKSKGREFDNVYMMLQNVQVKGDATLRNLYVGFTRARNGLYVHYYNTPIMNQVVSQAVERLIDNQFYEEPEEIALQLTHKDVFLSFFKDKKRDILQLHSGHALEIYNDFLCIRYNESLRPVVKFSRGFNEKMQGLLRKGYSPLRAEIRCIVAWKGEEDVQESAVILPNVYFVKNK